jgi:hypothetical protein
MKLAYVAFNLSIKVFCLIARLISQKAVRSLSPGQESRAVGSFMMRPVNLLLAVNSWEIFGSFDQNTDAIGRITNQASNNYIFGKHLIHTQISGWLKTACHNGNHYYWSME